MTKTIQIPEYFFGFFNSEVRNEFQVSGEKRNDILKRFPLLLETNAQGIFDINNFSDKQKVHNIVLLLSDFVKQNASNGNKFLKMNFTNGMGNVPAKMWDNGGLSDVIEMFEKNSVFVVNADINEYKGNKSLVIKKITPFKGDINPTELLPVTTHSIEDMIVELYLYLEDLKEPFRTIAFQGLEKYWSEFSTKVAAKRNHHNYLSGLLHHTIGLIRLAHYLTKSSTDPYQGMLKLMTLAEKKNKQELYKNLSLETPIKMKDLVWNGAFDHLNCVFEHFTRVKDVELDADLLICGALFHDIGKILEYSHAGENWIEKWKQMYPNADFNSFENKKETGITMDPVGGGTGHIPLGISMLRDVVNDSGVSIKIEDIGKLNHCIAAHHGKLEWGSAAWMETPEAILLHFVDMMDARWNRCEKK